MEKIVHLFNLQQRIIIEEQKEKINYLVKDRENEKRQTSASGKVFRPRSFLSSNNPPPIILRASSLIITSLASNFRSGIVGLDSIVYQAMLVLDVVGISLIMTLLI